MTVDGTNNRKDYDPDGIVTTFGYNFRVDNKEDLSIYADSVAYLEPFSITGLGEELGGDVIFDVAPIGSIEVLTLIREVDLTQQTAYPPLGPFPAPSHEKALDKLTWIAQQLDEAIGRSLSAPVGEGSVDYTLPVYEAGEFWRWDPSEQKIISSELGDIGLATIGLSVGDLVQLVLDGSEAKFPLGVIPDIVGTIPPASETVKGLAELATQTETDDGEDDLKIVSPLKLETRLSYLAKGILITTDEKPSGTSGGVFSPGAWRTRDQNTVRKNTIPGAALAPASGRITMPAGEYYVEAYGISDGTVNNKLGIYNVEDALHEPGTIGANAQWVGGNAGPAILSGYMSFEEARTLELQHYCSGAGSFGDAASFGVNEVYSGVTIWEL